jgi:hypothetical protein
VFLGDFVEQLPAQLQPRTRQSVHPQRSTVLTSETCRSIGVKHRTERVGPELELVASFVNGGLFSAPPLCEMAIFQEPRLPSGFPDLVVVLFEAVSRGGFTGLQLSPPSVTSAKQEACQFRIGLFPWASLRFM